jgi:hypothetical protein
MTAARHRRTLLESSVDIIPKRPGGGARRSADGGTEGGAAAYDGANGCPSRGANRASAQGSLLLGRHVCTSHGGTEYDDE